ncbi:hypothetical protein VIGAN_09120500, partial [Vigna angularis var. angularis]
MSDRPSIIVFFFNSKISRDLVMSYFSFCFILIKINLKTSTLHGALPSIMVLCLILLQSNKRGPTWTLLPSLVTPSASSLHAASQPGE